MEGELCDNYQEFFVQENTDMMGRSLSEQNDWLWRHKYSLCPAMIPRYTTRTEGGRESWDKRRRMRSFGILRYKSISNLCALVFSSTGL